MALRPVLPGPGPDRGAGHAGRLPRRDAAAPRPDLRLQPLRLGSVPARLLQGGAAAGRGAGVPGRGRPPDRRGGGWACALAPRRSGWSALAGVLALGAWPLVTGQAQDAPGLLQGDPGRVARSGAPSSTASSRATRGRSCCPATCSRSTPGAAPSTRSCRRCPSGRWPSAPRSPTPTCGRPTCCGRSTGSCTSAAACPGQLAPLLSLIGVRQVITGTDDDLARSDAPPPADAASELAAQPGSRGPRAATGRSSSFAPSGVGPAQRLAQVRRYDLPRARGIVRVEPARQPDRRRRLGRRARGAGRVRRAAADRAAAVRRRPDRGGAAPAGRAAGAMS